ncbi:SRPBCC family protein [Rhodococcus sp. NPDC003318]|uniref:SRPBCC family protein n=1 Tax=Rhodococcus sp. NPDC003318 TaxID=3364503 RepID=UPI0036BEC3FA
MAEVRVRQEFADSASQVWAIVGDPGAVDRWIPSVESVRMDGTMRHIVFPDGQPARERIAAHSDAGRHYTYEYVDGPLALAHYSSTLTVVETSPTTCAVEWNATFAATSPEAEPELVQGIEAIYRAALGELTTVLAAAH